jgi:DNA invertase Pin-like site-specific DNA recombinase
VAAKVHEMYGSGVGKKKIARTLSIGNSTVANILKDYKEAD